MARRHAPRVNDESGRPVLTPHAMAILVAVKRRALVLQDRGNLSALDDTALQGVLC